MVQATVNSAASEPVPRNAARKGITFSNRSAGGQILHISPYGGKGLTITNSEYVLSVGESMSFTQGFDGVDITGEWGAVASADGGVLVWSETAERKEVR